MPTLVAATDRDLPPRQTLSSVRQDSRLISVCVLLSGTVGLAVAILGPLVAISVGGWTPASQLTLTLTSATFRGLLVVASCLGLIAVVLALPTYRRLATITSRGQTLSGAVLGVEALAIGAGALWFSYGEVATFARNFLNFAVVPPYLHAFVTGIKNTIILAITGEVGGIVCGLAAAALLISPSAVVRAPARIYVNLVRGTPLIWQISIIYFGFALGIKLPLSAYTAAIAAFALFVGAYSAEVFRAGLQSIDRGQFEAARTVGMTYMQAMRYVIVPQAVRRVLPPLLNEFVSLIKDTSLVLVIGLSASELDLFSTGNLVYGNTFDATFFVVTGIAYLVVTIPLIWAVNRVESRLRVGRAHSNG